MISLSIYLALESDFSQVSNSTMPLDRERRQLRRFQRPKMSMFGQKGTKMPGKRALPKCLQTTRKDNKYYNKYGYY